MSLPGLGLPGLGLEEPSEQPQTLEATQHELSPGFEWRFEVGFGKSVKVKLLKGTAEVFGSELIQGPTYIFSGTKAAVFTHHGCTIETSKDAPQSEYTAEETPMTEYVNVNFALDALRSEAKAQGKVGPRVLLLGPSAAGKTSLAKLLTAYAIRLGRQPIVANLDPEEGMLSLPGTLTAVAFRTLLDIEEGWGSSPMSGPSPNPVKLPLVYHYGVRDPTANESSSEYYKSVISKLALAVSGRQNEDLLARESGLLVDTPGTLSNSTKPTATGIIQHIVSEFAISHILILGSERLYSDMLRRFDNKPTSSNNITTAPEKLTVAKLSKSGGCVDRDEAFMRAHRAAQIRAYFLGTPHLSNGLALSPRQQLVDFNQLVIYRLNGGDDAAAATAADSAADLFRPGGQEDLDDDDDADDTNHNHNHNHNHNDDDDNTDTNFARRQPDDPYNSNNRNRKKINLLSLLPATPTSPPPPSLHSHILAITSMDPHNTAATATTSDHDAILTSPILGFLYVTEVDEPRRKVGLLSPVSQGHVVPGGVGRRVLVWSRGWPEEVVGVV